MPKLYVTHKGSKKGKYWKSKMGRAHMRAFWRDLAIEMFGR